HQAGLELGAICLPLPSKLDLLLFKKDIYDTILKYFEHSTEINFPYGINIYEYSPTKNTYSSLNSNLYTKDNMIQGIIDEVIVAMYRATLKYLKEKGKYDVALIFQTCFDKNNSQKVGWDKNGHLKCWWYVDKKNIKNPNNIKYNVDSNRKNSRYSTPYIEFEELDAKDVDSFKIFFDPGWASDNGKTDNNKNKEFVKWCDKNNITHSYYAWRANDMARTFTINNFMGKDFSFKVDFDFDGKSNSDRGTGIGPKNLDQKILSLGADNLGLRFDLDVKLNPNFKYDDTILGDYIQKEINGLSATSSFFQIVRNKVSEIIKPKFTKNIVKFSDFILKFVYDKFDYNKEVKDSRYNNPSNFYNKMFTIEPGANIVDNRLIFEDRVSNEYFKKGTAEKHSQSELHNIQVEYDNLLQKQDASSINNTNPSNLKNTELSVLLKQDNNLRFVIEYNKNPLFVLEQPIIFPDGNWRSTFKDLGKSNFKANSGISVDDWVSKFTNVSNKFSKEKVNPNSTENNYYNLIDMNKSTNNIVQKEVEYIKGKKINGWEFNYDTNNAIYYKTNSRPTLSNSLGLDSYKINSIIEVYNNLINQYSATKNLNKPEDVVYLYDLYDGQRLSPVDLSYREFLSNGSNQSLSLYSGNAVNLYSDRLTLSLAIDKTQTTSPATVVILRDSRGRIVNPGVTVTKDEQTLITSDAVFDSKQTILQNFYRQKVIPKSENIVYYDDGGKYTPLENKVNQIYFLNIKENVVDNSQDQTSNKEVTKTIYFLSYKDCWNYVFQLRLR
ncbi:MAG: hypothetical protein K2L64_03365, partial [Ureaplasma sp.]|nr:hypothetical protein [Ureaplasma sp.]